jgi:hypothetical protein
VFDDQNLYNSAILVLNTILHYEQESRDLSEGTYLILPIRMMTFGITAFGITAFGIRAFSIMTFGIMAFSMMTFGMTAFGITAFGITAFGITHSA